MRRPFRWSETSAKENCLKPPPCGYALRLAVPAGIATAQSSSDDFAGMPHWALAAHSDALQVPIPEKITIAPIPPSIPQSDTTIDPAGSMTTYQSDGPITTSDNAFFQSSLGSNGRSCFSCHEPQDEWTIIQMSRPVSTKAKAPIRYSARSMGQPVPMTRWRRWLRAKSAYKLYLARGLIQFSTMPPAIDRGVQNHESESRTDAHEPQIGLTSPRRFVSVYRRPLPATNLKFETTLMWDGREPDLSSQATDATLIHAAKRSRPRVPGSCSR